MKILSLLKKTVFSFMTDINNQYDTNNIDIKDLNLVVLRQLIKHYIDLFHLENKISRPKKDKQHDTFIDKSNNYSSLSRDSSLYGERPVIYENISQNDTHRRDNQNLDRFISERDSGVIPKKKDLDPNILGSQVSEKAEDKDDF